MLLTESNFIIIGVFAVLSIYFLLFVGKIMDKPERGWLFYPVILALLPFYLIYLHFFVRSEGPSATFIKVFLPIVALTMTIFIIWMSRQIVVERENAFEKGPLFYPFLFFIVANALSLYMARDIRSGLVILFAWIFIFLSYIATYNTIEDMNTVKRFVLLYIGACTFLALFGMYKFFILKDIAAGINPFIAPGRVAFFEKNEFGFIMEEVFFLSFLLYTSHQLSRTWRRFCLISFFIILTALIFSFSRGAWVSMLAAFLYLWFISRPGAGTKRKLIGFSLIALLIGVFFFANFPNLEERFSTLWKPETYPERRLPLIGAFKAFLHYPILGVGVNNYDEYYLFKFLPPEGVIMMKGWRVPMVGVPILYLRALTETGIIGFIGLMWVIVAIYKELVKKIKAIKEDSLEKAMLVGFLAGFVANLVHFFFISYVWPIPWLYFLFAVALTKVIGQQKPV